MNYSNTAIKTDNTTFIQINTEKETDIINRNQIDSIIIKREVNEVLIVMVRNKLFYNFKDLATAERFIDNITGSFFSTKVVINLEKDKETNALSIASVYDYEVDD